MINTDPTASVRASTEDLALLAPMTSPVATEEGQMGAKTVRPGVAASIKEGATNLYKGAAKSVQVGADKIANGVTTFTNGVKQAGNQVAEDVIEPYLMTPEERAAAGKKTIVERGLKKAEYVVSQTLPFLRKAEDQEENLAMKALRKIDEFGASVADGIVVFGENFLPGSIGTAAGIALAAVVRAIVEIAPVAIVAAVVAVATAIAAGLTIAAGVVTVAVALPLVAAYIATSPIWFFPALSTYLYFENLKLEKRLDALEGKGPKPVQAPAEYNFEMADLNQQTDITQGRDLFGLNQNGYDQAL